jgi:hypothetical protein
MNLAPLLLPLILAVPPPGDSYEIRALPAVQFVHILDDNSIFLFHTNGSSTVLPSIENLELRGWHGHGPIVATVFNARLGSHSLETIHTAKGREHRVITKCYSTETLARCAVRHAKWLAAVEKQFPK